MISEELEEKLKKLVLEKRKIVHFDDDIVYAMVYFFVEFCIFFALGSKNYEDY